MQAPNYIALAIPAFFLLMGVELLVAWRRGARAYRFADAVTDLGCGVTQQVLVLFMAGTLLAGYAWLYRHCRLLPFAPGSIWPWAIGFAGVDFLYYWWHRLSHEVNLLWAAHVVHHQSEDYNLAVALRQGALTDLTAWLFYAPLALLGVPPVAFVTVHSFVILYQFWIHTELVGRLGPIEWLLNTPSQHRVHHAINPRYLDKNYGGTFMIWDRLFGTLAAETEPPVYGTVKPIASFNPAWAQVEYWVELGRRARSARRAIDKLRVWWMPPAWRGGGAPPSALPEVSPVTFRKYDPPQAPATRAYVAAHLVAVLAATSFLLFFAARIPLRGQVTLAALVLLTLVALGALLERRRWAVPLEVARLGMVAMAVVVALRSA